VPYRTDPFSMVVEAQVNGMNVAQQIDMLIAGKPQAMSRFLRYAISISVLSHLCLESPMDTAYGRNSIEFIQSY
jgi:hypothetical protein